MEYEKIKEWITSGISNELIILALKEAVLNGVGNLNYIDKILVTWKKKGYKNKKDIDKDKEMYQEKKEKNDIFLQVDKQERNLIQNYSYFFKMTVDDLLTFILDL